jgi:hypothetical protein
MQIDSNDEQSENAERPIRFSCDSDSNVNDESDSQSQKQLSQITSIQQGIITDSSDPKYRIRETPWKPVRNEPETLKRELPSSTLIVEICEPSKAEQSISFTEAGRKSEFRDEQPVNTRASIRRNFEPDSKANDKSESHPLKLR